MNEDDIQDVLDAEATPEPESDRVPAFEQKPAQVDENGVQTVSESDVQTVDENDVQALPDVAAAPAQAAEPPPGNNWDDAGLLLAQGATLGAREEILGAGYGAVEGAKNIFEGPGAAFRAAKAKYDQISGAEHQNTQNARARNPYLGVGYEALGSLAAPIGALGMGKGLVGAVGTGAATGALAGALENPNDRLGGAAQGGVVGGVLPGVVGGVGKLATSGLAATGAGMMAPNLDKAFYADLLQNPALRKQTLSARTRYPDVAAAGEQVGELLGDVVGGVREKSVESKLAGNEALVQQGFLGEALTNAKNYVKRTFQFVDSPENDLNYSTEFKKTLAKVYGNLEGKFPEANAISSKLLRKNELEAHARMLEGNIAIAQASRKNALMDRRIANLTKELEETKANLDPLAQEVDNVMIKGYHEARQDLDSIINWNPGSNVPRPQRADQQQAIKVREYIDGILKTSPEWKQHDELYSAWAPLESALKTQIMETGGTGNVSYKKVWSLISGAGGEAAAADKKALIDDFSSYVTKHFSNNPEIMNKLQKFQTMAEDLTLAKRFQGMASATGMTTGRFGAAIGNPSRMLAAPVAFPTLFLQALDKSNSAKEFLEKINPGLPNAVRNRVIIMVNQAIKQKPDLSVEEAAKIVQNQVQQGESK
jgi:hypothetical protein